MKLVIKLPKSSTDETTKLSKIETMAQHNLGRGEAWGGRRGANFRNQNNPKIVDQIVDEDYHKKIVVDSKI